VLFVDPGTETAEVVGIADFLPAAAAYAIVRPSTTLLSTTMPWFRRWLHEVAPASRSIVLVGFSRGAPFAGGLLLDDPSRYAGAAMLQGTLPFGAGVPTDDGRLEGIPVLVAQAEDDHVIPRELLDRTWDYLHDRSRAEVTGRREPGRHEFTYASLAGLQIWLAQLLTDQWGDT
jgi:phospholipase/carboxylesterase